ncbi:hypothetical protein GQ43DRAFT_291228 [Delitschia confertaspora ATCC 74209]|uniref:Uncharacterized protein n=1 Tax=Delitschia confertaspora ATCC 74209 TaxID=1513339 RepID=A0A9P4MTW7_9PLEO|nr:hypothetical protein GQ43DRAFT_291228 [Delitschia confertaspora ATCC 74209]
MYRQVDLMVDKGTLEDRSLLGMQIYDKRDPHVFHPPLSSPHFHPQIQILNPYPRHTDIHQIRAPKVRQHNLSRQTVCSSGSPLGCLASLPPHIRQRIYFWTIGPILHIDEPKHTRVYHRFATFLPPICYASRSIYRESKDVIFQAHIKLRNVSTFVLMCYLDSFVNSASLYQAITSLELDSVHTIPSMCTNGSFYDQRAVLLRCTNLQILEIGLYRKVTLETHYAANRKSIQIMVNFLFFPDILHLSKLKDLTIHVRDRRLDVPPSWEWDWHKQVGETKEWVSRQFRKIGKHVKVTMQVHEHTASGQPWHYPYYEGRTDLRDQNDIQMMPIVKHRYMLARGRDFANPPPMPNVG